MRRGDIPGRDGGGEKPKPGSDGITTSNASAASPPNRLGWVNMGRICSNSRNDPGQPWIRTSGMGAVPSPRAWTK